MAAGATVCTVHIEMNRNQLGNIFERLKPRLILYQDGLALDDLLAATAVPRLRLGRWDKPEAGTLFAELARLPPSDSPPYPPRMREGEGAGPDDDAIILFTSGTSATPKGVILNFREYLLNIDPLAEGFGITADDRLYDFRPFSWNSAQTLGALAVVNRGATLVLSEKFSASRFFQHLREHDVTISTGNPTTINILLNSEQICMAHLASRQPAEAALCHLELGAAPARRVEAVRAEIRHPGRAGLRRQRSELDRRHSRRAAPSRHGRAAVCLSRSRHRRCRRPALAGRRNRLCGARRARRSSIPLSRRRRRGEGAQPRPLPHRRSRLARCRRLLDAQRPREGADHPRRRQDFAGRDRFVPDAARRRDRSGDHRRAGCDLRRRSDELRRGAARASMPRRCYAIAPAHCRPSRRRSGSC